MSLSLLASINIVGFARVRQMVPLQSYRIKRGLEITDDNPSMIGGKSNVVDHLDRQEIYLTIFSKIRALTSYGLRQIELKTQLSLFSFDRQKIMTVDLHDRERLATCYFTV